MIAVLKTGTSQEQIEHLTEWLKSQGLGVHISEGQFQTIVGLVGDTSRVDEELLAGLDMVESVKRISEPFKSANRKFHPDDSVIEIPAPDGSVVKIGGGNFAAIAGPCSVESEEQILEVARSVKASGASLLRGGAFKPRTSPYDFQGLKADGIALLLEAKKETGLPIVTEIMSADHLPLFEEAADRRGRTVAQFLQDQNSQNDQRCQQGDRHTQHHINRHKFRIHNRLPLNL